MRAFEKSLRNANHVRRYSIEATDAGWDIREEQDSRVLWQVCLTDWHRVERARRAFTLEMNDLQRQGWAEVDLR